MGCSNCKKKKIESETLKASKKKIIEPDRAITWVIVAWLLLGVYGLFSLISNIFHLFQP